MTQHAIPAAALAVGDRLYAGEWVTIRAIHYSTPEPGKLTIETRELGTLPPVGANAKVSIDTA